MDLPGGVDTSSVIGAGAFATAIAAIAVPLWRRWLAKQLTETGKDRGELTWMGRQHAELERHQALVAELLKLRTADAELIAGLRLKIALDTERTERMQLSNKRLKQAIIELRPDLEPWLRSDFDALPDADQPFPLGPLP